MKLPRRQFLHLATGAAALPAVSRIASAQTYPSRPVRILVGFPAGGANDIYARVAGQILSERLRQSFFIENRPGAGGNTATEAAVRAPPDGYTLLLASAVDAWNASLYDNLRFKFTINRGMGVVLVSPSFPAKTIPEFSAYIRANPGKMAVASAGIGSGPHLYWALFKSMTGVDMLHVPYRGEAQALIDLLGGQVQVYFGNMAAAIEHIKSGRLRALAVTSATRAEALPDIPAIAEFVPGYDGSGWTGIGAPKNTSAEIVDRLNRAINAGLDDPAIRTRIAGLGGVPAPMTAAEFGGFILEYTNKWANVIRAANIKPE